MTTANPFDPTSEYNVPKGDSKYLKFEKGQTTFQPVSSPIIGWEYWTTDNKPVRLSEPPQNPSQLPNIKKDEDGRVRVNHFWAFPVIDEADGKVKVLEITQKTIQGDIRAYTKNPKWGSPVMKYSFTVEREGDGFETKYTVMANPAAEIPNEWVAEWERVVKAGFDLEELFDGGDPFAPGAKEAEAVYEGVDEDTEQPEA